MTQVLQLRRLHPAATLPAKMSEEAAGFDLAAVVSDNPLGEGVVLEPGARLLVNTGLAIALPTGFEAQVRPRSGLALKHGVTVLNSPGTIDSDYRGEVKVLLINHGADDFMIRTGERIAQLVVAKVAQLSVSEVTELPHATRGGAGFGSTGK